MGRKDNKQDERVIMGREGLQDLNGFGDLLTLD